MKTIGLIGGLSWESSAAYYRVINQDVQARLGGHHSAESLMYSVDFAEIEQLQVNGAWDDAAARMIAAARRLERGGAACVVICSNTMHKMADDVAAAVDIPLLHIVDATAAAIKRDRVQTIGLLGTIYTMEQTFYSGRLIEKHGLGVTIPEAADRQVINRIIYDELTMGVIKPESKLVYVDAIRKLALAGAQAVILGCTEISLLIKPEDSPIPTYDTTAIHARAAVDFALA